MEKTSVDAKMVLQRHFPQNVSLVRGGGYLNLMVKSTFSMNLHYAVLTAACFTSVYQVLKCGKLIDDFVNP